MAYHRAHRYTVNSSKRLSSSVSETSFQYNLNITHNAHSRVLLTRVVIPKTYFNVAQNNTFTLTELGIDTTITIPLGNYDFQDLADNLKTLLDAGSTNTATFTVTASEITGKLSFSCDKAASITLGANSGIESVLGLTLSSTYTMPFSSDNICLFNEHDSLSIISNIVGDSNRVLATIPIAHNSHWDYSTYVYTDRVIDSKIMNHAPSNVYEFTLVNSAGSVVNLNGLSWSFDIIVYVDMHDLTFSVLKQAEKFFTQQANLMSLLEKKQDTNQPPTTSEIKLTEKKEEKKN